MISPHFSLLELTITDTGLPNVPTAEDQWRLRILAIAVLEPWRGLCGGRPMRVTSGFRSPAVNAELRRRGYSASSTSQHLRGEAVDVQPDLIVQAWQVLRDAARAGLPVDQAIVYQRPAGVGWIHVSVATDRLPRHEFLVQPAGSPGSYVDWARWAGDLVTR